MWNENILDSVTFSLFEENAQRKYFWEIVSISDKLKVFNIQKYGVEKSWCSSQT